MNTGTTVSGFFAHRNFSTVGGCAPGQSYSPRTSSNHEQIVIKLSHNDPFASWGWSPSSLARRSYSQRESCAPMDARWLKRSSHFFRYPVFRKTIAGVILLCLYAEATLYVESHIIGHNVAFPDGMHALLAISLSMLMVFRNNSSYDRWWEGRKAWGALVNESRALASVAWNLNGVAQEERQRFLQEISKFAYQLRDHLRGPWPAPDNLPERSAMQMSKSIGQWNDQGLLSTHQFLSLESHIAQLYHCLGICERIRGTPLPLSHRAIIPQILVCYLLGLPWVLPNNNLSVLVIALAAYFLISLELISEELEDPFGHEPDDLPLTRTCIVIEKSMGRQSEA